MRGSQQQTAVRAFRHSEGLFPDLILPARPPARQPPAQLIPFKAPKSGRKRPGCCGRGRTTGHRVWLARRSAAEGRPRHLRIPPPRSPAGGTGRARRGHRPPHSGHLPPLTPATRRAGAGVAKSGGGKRRRRPRHSRTIRVPSAAAAAAQPA